MINIIIRNLSNSNNRIILIFYFKSYLNLDCIQQSTKHVKFQRLPRSNSAPKIPAQDGVPEFSACTPREKGTNRGFLTKWKKNLKIASPESRARFSRWSGENPGNYEVEGDHEELQARSSTGTGAGANFRRRGDALVRRVTSMKPD